MPETTDDETRVIARVREALAGRRSGPAWIGVDGLGGSGKTRLAATLGERLGVPVVAADDFAGDDVATWNHDRFRREVVEPLSAGRPGRYRRWAHGSAPAEWVEVPVGPVVVEGVSATDAALGLDWALTVWVEAPADVRRRRIAERDGAALARVWAEEWIPSEERYRREQRPDERADLIFGSGS